MTTLEITKPRARADWRAVTLICAVVILAFGATSLQRQTAMRQAAEQRRELTVQLRKVCAVLDCERRHGP